MSRYCSYCAKFGHLTSACPAKPSRLFTEPAFVEQLIPFTELLQHRIYTRTPLEEVKDEPVRRLEIKNNSKVISAYLSARGIKSVKGKTKQQLLEEYAALDNRRVVYVG